MNSAAQKTSTTSRARIGEDVNVGKYKMIKTIGKGNFAKVKLARHVVTNCEVAIKVIDKTALNQASLQKVSTRRAFSGRCAE